MHPADKLGRSRSPKMLSIPLVIIGERERDNLVVQLARFFYIYTRGMLSIFGERERPNYSAIRCIALKVFPTDLVCTGHIYRRVDCLICTRKRRRNVVYIYTCIQSTLLLGMYGAERRDRRVSLSLRWSL